MRSESASCERDPCRALINAQLTEEDVATRPQVDPKTVLRWLEGSLPYLRHHWGAATMLGEDETDLWPQLRPSRTKPDEVVAIYPHRDTVPRVLWLRLTGSAQHEIGILDSTGPSPASRQPIVAALAERAESGLRVRISTRHLSAFLGDRRSLHTVIADPKNPRDIRRSALSVAL